MKTVPTTVTYLEMLSAPENRPESAPCELSIEAIERMPIGEYRELYDAVGGPFNWIARKLLSDADLAEIIHHPQVDLHVLTIDGEPSGFAELDRRKPGEIEVLYFGIVARQFGKGLGRYWLNWTIHQAWSHGIERLWLHTCTLDHAQALPNYRKAGFRVFDEKQIMQQLADA